MSGVRFNGVWRSIASAYYKENGQWKLVENYYAKSEGEWHNIDLQAEQQDPAYHTWIIYADSTDAATFEERNVSLESAQRRYVGIQSGKRKAEPVIGVDVATISDLDKFQWSKIKGEDGKDGKDGKSGQAVEGKRGAGHYYAYLDAKEWSDTVADDATPFENRPGDRVTLFNNADFTETRYWDGEIWNDTEQKVIDATLVVNGDALIPQIFANDITVTQSVTAENSGTRVQMSATGNYAFLATRGSDTIFAVGGDDDFINGTALKRASVGANALSQGALDLIKDTVGALDTTSGGSFDQPFTFSTEQSGQRAIVTNFPHGENPLYLSADMEGNWVTDKFAEAQASLTCYIEIKPIDTNNWTTLRSFQPEVNINDFNSKSGDEYVKYYSVRVTGDFGYTIPSTYSAGEYDLRLRITGNSQTVSGVFTVREKVEGATANLPRVVQLDQITFNKNKLIKTDTGLIRNQSLDGYIDFGANNTSWAHFYTDRDKFYFDKPVHSKGGFGVYQTGTVVDGSKIKVGSSVPVQLDNGHIRLDDRRAIKTGDGDQWLRINENGDFSSGIYTGGSIIRTDEELQVGNQGSAFKANKSEVRSKVSTRLRNATIEKFAGDNQIVAMLKHPTASGSLAMVSENKIAGSFRFEANPAGDLRIQTTGTDGSYRTADGDAGSIARFYRNGDVVVKRELRANDVVATSDRRVKSDLKPIKRALKLLSQVNGYTYWQRELETRAAGYIAQELEAVLPESVETDTRGRKHVRMSAPIGLLIQAVNELAGKVEQLERDAWQ